MLGLDPSTAISTARNQDATAFGDRMCGGARVKPEHDESAAALAPNH
jgi:hypothetical protein